MSTLSLYDVRSLGDPQKAYKWRAVLPFIGDSLVKKGNDALGSAFDQVGGGGSVGFLTNKLQSVASSALTSNKLNSFITGFNPSDYVEEVQGLPFPNVEREPFYEGGRNTYFPGIEDVGSFTIVFYQDESDRIQNYMFKWKALIVNPDGTKNYPSTYKQSINVRLLDNANRTIFSYRLLGCFPTISSPYNLNNTSDRIVWAQEFSVDRVEIVPTDTLAGFLTGGVNVITGGGLDKLKSAVFK